jgi:hypothetical protein
MPCCPRCANGAVGPLLERRAVVGGLCEPALLDSSRAVVVLGLLDEIAAGLTREADRRSDEFKAL